MNKNVIQCFVPEFNDKKLKSFQVKKQKKLTRRYEKKGEKNQNVEGLIN